MTPEAFAEVASGMKDHELIVYRNTVEPIEGWPNGFECLIAIPKAKLRALRDAGGKPPFWRHGEVIEARPPRPDSGGTEASAAADHPSSLIPHPSSLAGAARCLP